MDSEQLAEAHKTSSMKTIDKMSDLELVNYVGDADVNSAIGKTGRLLLYHRFTSRLSKVIAELSSKIEGAAHSESRLSAKLLFLNWVLTIATLIMGIEAAIKIWNFWGSPAAQQTLTSEDTLRLKTLIQELGNLTLAERIEMHVLERDIEPGAWEKRDQVQQGNGQITKQGSGGKAPAPAH